MGKVVKLDGSAKDRSASKRPPAKRTAVQRTPVSRRPSRTALVLGGGGFTGGVYEIGALRALDLLSVRHTVNEFDVYVGTSAGSFVAAAVANGVTPEEMMRVIVQQVPTPFPDASISSLLKPNYREFLTRGAKFPLRLARLLHALARDVGQISAVDVVLGLADALPTGLYSAEGIERYVRAILSDPARTDDFRELRRELYVIATDLDSCERMVFGAEGADEVPISKAVSASSALPMIYKPVRIGNREYIDGGLVSTTNLDIAVERGAKFIVVVNPLVPYVNDTNRRIPTLSGSRTRRVSDMGFPQIGYQAFKLIAHQRLHEVARRWEERYPGVDIVLIEPDPTDELMFQTSVLNFTSRVDIARHGFESVTLQLAHDYQRFKWVAARHGIEISATRVRKVVKHFEHASLCVTPGSGLRRGSGPERRRAKEFFAGWALRARGLSPDRLRDGRLPKGREEQSLVDPTVEDRDAQLNAFDDDVASFEASFARELGGRQMVCHRGVSPLQRFT